MSFFIKGSGSKPNPVGLDSYKRNSPEFCWLCERRQQTRRANRTLVSAITGPWRRHFAPDMLYINFGTSRHANLSSLFDPRNSFVVVSTFTKG